MGRKLKWAAVKSVDRRGCVWRLEKRKDGRMEGWSAACSLACCVYSRRGEGCEGVKVRKGNLIFARPNYANKACHFHIFISCIRLFGSQFLGNLRSFWELLGVGSWAGTDGGGGGGDDSRWSWKLEVEVGSWSLVEKWNGFSLYIIYYASFVSFEVCGPGSR